MKKLIAFALCFILVTVLPVICTVEENPWGNVEFFEGRYYDVDGRQVYYNPATHIIIDTKRFSKTLEKYPTLIDFENAMILGTAYMEIHKKSHKLHEEYYIDSVCYDEEREIYFFSLKDGREKVVANYIMAVSQKNGALLDVVLNE